MADNINVDPGTGVGAVPVATDDVGGIQYQVIKIATGADGAATVISSANPLPIGDAGGSLTVDGTVAVTGTVTANVGTGTQPVSGTVAATQSGTWTVQPGNTANTTAWKVDGSAVTQPVSGTVTVNGISTTAYDRGAGAATAQTMRVTMDTGQVTPIGPATMANSTPVTMATDQTVIPMAGGIAHDAADSGNPIKMGWKATTSLSALTLVAAADRTDAFAGVDGVQITRPHCNLEDVVATGTFTDTAGSSTSFVVSSGAGVKTYLTSIILCNTSATNVVVAIKDGTTTKITLPVPATSGCVFNPPVPIPGTAATAWNFHPSAAATTIHCSGVGFKSKV